MVTYRLDFMVYFLWSMSLFFSFILLFKIATFTFT